jgi:hypothetical protein
VITRAAAPLYLLFPIPDPQPPIPIPMLPTFVFAGLIVKQEIDSSGASPRAAARADNGYVLALAVLDAFEEPSEFRSVTT